MSVTPPSSSSPDVVIVGAGIIGLSLALELHHRGHRVTVLERDTALSHASTAAAGMLAAEDPHNPPALLPLSRLSLQLYPVFLDRIAALSGIVVPLQTDTTLQYLPDGTYTRLAEHSLDPRQLAAALLAAIHATPIHLREHTPFAFAEEQQRGETAITTSGDRIETQSIVFASGAWTTRRGYGPIVKPRKGQMLRVALPTSLRDLREVHRSDRIYIVPRITGPHAGTALIGATVEDAGFDTTTSTTDLQRLRLLAADLLPALVEEAAAPQVEAWAGLRPATIDHLPILGRSEYSSTFFATGHYRNGILLAPATATVLADLLDGKQPQTDLAAFSPDRFSPVPRNRGLPD